SHQERIALLVEIVGLAVNVAVNAVAIPLYGAKGAAAALVVSDLVFVVGQLALVHRNLFRVPFREILTKPLLVVVVVVPVAILIATKSPLSGGVFGATVFAGGLIAMGYVTTAEWRPVTLMIRAPLGRIRTSK